MKCTAESLDLIKKDSAYHDLGTLPSGGLPYNDKNFQVFIRPFRFTELRLLSKAVELSEMSHLIRAVDNTISVPVNTLTIGDFFYVLLWLRLYSMPKSPYVTEWKCEQPYFTHKETRVSLLYTDKEWPSVEELKKDYDVEPCGTENTCIVHQSDIQILNLDENTVLPEGLDYPRMGSYIGRAAALKDPELALIAPAIQWIEGLTWEEKMAKAESNVSLLGDALDVNRKVIHGISETIKFNCRRCRIEHTQTLDLNALSFFR